MDLVIWRRRLIGDVVRAAYAEGHDIAALEADLHLFLTGRLTFRRLTARVPSVPLRSNWSYRELSWPHCGETHILTFANGASWARQVRRVWTWAEWAVRDVQKQQGTAVPEHSLLLREAHWHLYARINWQTAEAALLPLHLWWERPDWVQCTRAEQFILANPHYLGHWHPYRETTGVMRRAPLWNLLLVGEWSQVGHAVMEDSRPYQTSLAATVAALLAHAAEESAMDPYALVQANWARHLGRSAGHETILGTALNRFDEEELRDSASYWQRFYETYRWFPYDHVLPNFLIILAALRQHPYDIPAGVAFVRTRGFDFVGNALIVAALVALHLRDDTPSTPLSSLPPMLEEGIRHTIKNTRGPRGPWDNPPVRK